ncbi:M48 family metallopeptidase [Pseudofulvibacter geojedonensis]|uniref:M48 family metallopeptidase n=1 Tax=Pseudofulvibacter geojedonensis TaxID=1123758 RepID=A0ABW3I1A5_9FLAO
MQAQTLFYIIIGILIFDFLLDSILNALNAKHFNDELPEKLKDVYDIEEYKKSQAYKATNYSFGKLSSIFSLVLTLIFLFIDGFKLINDYAQQFTNDPILVALIFFGIIMLGSDILTTPFAYYQTFVIEEKFGFNKSTKKLFFTDKLKGWLMSIILGGGILSLIIWFYEFAGKDFWVYAWGLVTFFSVFMNLFYTKLIVPLFNKQTPLEEGSLRDKIAQYANTVGFELKNIYVIDGSKRSTKANAYFSGFGNQKQITLYDTLINDLEEDEIVAVLAHEVGHYKKKHIIYNLILSTIITGFTLWLLSVFVSSPVLSQALGVNTPTFHVGLIAFGLLYSPLSELTGIVMNLLSRKFEYQADNYAKETFNSKDLISSLKKLSKNSLSNLTPHPWYVWFHYSHPSLLQRITNLNR